MRKSDRESSIKLRAAWIERGELKHLRSSFLTLKDGIENRAWRDALQRIYEATAPMRFDQADSRQDLDSHLETVKAVEVATACSWVVAATGLCADLFPKLLATWIAWIVI